MGGELQVMLEGEELVSYELSGGMNLISIYYRGSKGWD